MDKGNANECWKILVVDDDDDVQTITRMVLEDFEYLGRGLQLLQAKSGAEGLRIAREHDDIAVAIVDVVMETKLSGLNLVRDIREVVGDRSMRIILRTGQPGEAPESDVVIKYDINDYKEKAELTFQKLQTSVITAIRSYNDICSINRSREGLEKIIKASADLFKLQQMKAFASGLLGQLVSLLNLCPDALLGHISSLAAGVECGSNYRIYAATGEYSRFTDNTIDQIQDEELHHDILKAEQCKRGFRDGNRFILYFKTSTNATSIVYFRGVKSLTELEENLLGVFCSNISIAFDNLCLKTEIEETQKELILCLGEAIDMRSVETGTHVERVSMLCKLIGTKLGLAGSEVEKLSLIAPMHDVGKITIPDVILNKPGKLTPEEYEIMKTHSMNGYRLLSNSHRELFKEAAIIALQHHERYDGLGYPNGLRQDQIHIFARIVTLVDVFDALVSDRVYKKAWPLEDAINYLREHSGSQFDPMIVQVFCDNINEMVHAVNTDNEQVDG